MHFFAVLFDFQPCYLYCNQSCLSNTSVACNILNAFFCCAISFPRRTLSECFGGVEKGWHLVVFVALALSGVLLWNQCLPLEFHSMSGCGMEQHHFISWRTQLFMCKAFALEEYVKAVWACLCIFISSHLHRFISWLPHLLYVSLKECVMPKNVFQILNSVVPCRILLFCHWFGILCS